MPSNRCALLTLLVHVLSSIVLPVGVGLVAWLLRWLTDLTCSPYSQVCRTTSEFFSHAYAVVFSFLAIVALTKAKQIKDFVERIKRAIDVVVDASPPTAGKSKRD